MFNLSLIILLGSDLFASVESTKLSQTDGNEEKTVRIKESELWDEGAPRPAALGG